MPIYEFRCQQCQNVFSHFTRRVGDPFEPNCPACGSLEAERLISRVAYHRSTERIHEESGDPDKPGSGYYNDPRNIGRWAEKRFEQMGMEIPAPLREEIDAAREGTLPKQITD